MDTKADLIRELLLKPKFKAMQNQTLARFVREKHPNVFQSIESARYVIRSVKGQAGEARRKAVTDPEKTKFFEGLDNLPEPDAFELMPFKINHHKYKRLGVLSDIHIGHHDLEALKIALQYIKEKDIDCLLFNGDVFDGRSVSHWERDVKSLDAQHEIQMNRKFWGAVRKMFPNIPIIYKLGNHDIWWERYLRTHCIEVSGMPEFELHRILNLEQMQVQHVADLVRIEYGKLNILHGHEFRNRSMTVSPSRTNFMKSFDNILCGHNHQPTSTIMKDITGKQYGSWSTGCLCNLSAKYMPYNQWQHGFAIVDITDLEGSFQVHNKVILNGKVL